MTRRRLAYIARPYAERRTTPLRVAPVSDATAEPDHGPTPDTPECPERYLDVRCIRIGQHTTHTDGHAVVWDYRGETQ